MIGKLALVVLAVPVTFVALAIASAPPVPQPAAQPGLGMTRSSQQQPIQRALGMPRLDPQLVQSVQVADLERVYAAFDCVEAGVDQHWACHKLSHAMLSRAECEFLLRNTYGHEPNVVGEYAWHPNPGIDYAPGYDKRGAKYMWTCQPI
jgi:hypothetical protein